MIATISLSACSARGSEPVLEIYCPPIVEYSDEFNAGLADELTRIPEEDTENITEALIDYGSLRDTLRACYQERDRNASD